MAFISELKKDFQKLIIKDNLAQSYIFFGHESAEEKFLLARELANVLENKKWEIRERVLNDAHFIDASQEAGIDLVRSASQFLWQKPAVSQKRTLIINQADNLTLPAQNAILKISEEPPAHALIILIVRDPNVLLPAVISRFQKIFFARDEKEKNPNTTIAKEFLKSKTPKRKEMIKEIVESNQLLDGFIAGLLFELRREKIRNWQTIRELLKRWSLIKQFNTNKRLQLEAALLELK